MGRNNRGGSGSRKTVNDPRKFLLQRQRTLFKKAFEMITGCRNHGNDGRVAVLLQINGKWKAYFSDDEDEWPIDLKAFPNARLLQPNDFLTQEEIAKWTEELEDAYVDHATADINLVDDDVPASQDKLDPPPTKVVRSTYGNQDQGEEDTDMAEGMSSSDDSLTELVRPLKRMRAQREPTQPAVSDPESGFRRPRAVLTLSKPYRRMSPLRPASTHFTRRPSNSTLGPSRSISPGPSQFPSPPPSRRYL